MNYLECRYYTRKENIGPIQKRGFGDYYLKNISMIQNTGNYLEKTTGKGPAVLKNTYSRKLSCQMSSGISLGIKDLATQLGITCAKETIFSREYSVTIPAGKTYTIFIHPEYNEYRFELWKEGFFCDDKLGEYWFKQPTGLYIWWQETPY